MGFHFFFLELGIKKKKKKYIYIYIYIGREREREILNYFLSPLSFLFYIYFLIVYPMSTS